MIKSRRMRWAGHVARMRKKRNPYRIFVGKPRRKEITRKTRRRWVDNIKVVLRELGWGGMDWIHMAQDRDQWNANVNVVVNVWVL
jgi:transcription termination factor 2